MSELKGSGNSMVYDEIPTYEDLQRCKHCGRPLNDSDVFYGHIENVCNNCLDQEKLPWYCNDCKYDWECVGVPMWCIDCHSYNLDTPLTDGLNNLRHEMVSAHFNNKNRKEGKK